MAILIFQKMWDSIPHFYIKTLYTTTPKLEQPEWYIRFLRWFRFRGL